MHAPQKLTSELLGAAANRIGRRGRAGLVLLLEAYENAKDLHHDVWDFAVEIESLCEAGMTKSDLRWLVGKNYVTHAREITLSGDQHRSFRHSRNATFHKRTCFVLLEDGRPFAIDAFRQAATAPTASLLSNMNPNGARQIAPLLLNASSQARVRLNGHHSMPVPTWDRDRQELRMAGQLIKQFKVPAANQEIILAAFEEEQWPPRIDDPLPPHPAQDSKRRLHDTINSLNRNQKSSLIRFLGDGSGQGIRWEPVAAARDEVLTAEFEDAAVLPRRLAVEAMTSA